MYCASPKNFQPVTELLWAKPCEQPAFISRRRYSGRRAQGVRYEQLGHENFAERFGDYYLPGQWFHFQELGRAPRWCQCDALLFDFNAGRITILEFKYQHTQDAWWQLRKLYQPVISFLFPETLWKVGICEVVKWFDPATVFPEEVRMTKDIAFTDSKAFGVHIWKP